MYREIERACLGSINREGGDRERWNRVWESHVEDLFERDLYLEVSF